MLPDMKLRNLKQLQASGKVVMMVGDGINDAADVLLTRSELKGISELVRLSRISCWTILQNLSLSLGYNTLTIPLAMMGLINPLLGRKFRHRFTQFPAAEKTISCQIRCFSPQLQYTISNQEPF